MNENHRYYYQVEQQLLCTPTTRDDFVASDGRSCYIHKIMFDEKFWEQKSKRLEEFYNDTILLELGLSPITGWSGKNWQIWHCFLLLVAAASSR